MTKQIKSIKGTAKYDWPKIKQAFFESDIIEIQNFIRTYLQLDENKPLSAEKKQATKGWRREKLAYRQKMIEAENQKTIDNPEVQQNVKRLNQALMIAEQKVASLLASKENFEIEDLPRIKVGYEILRLATGKSTSNQGGDRENPIQLEMIKLEL